MQMEKKIGKIEEMPAGARLTGIVVEKGSLIMAIGSANCAHLPGCQCMKAYNPDVINRSVSIKPNRIEVHEDCIVLLSGKPWKSKNLPNMAAEVSIEIGQLVEWEI
ncbi:hypothetical protein [Erwinia phage Snitter]|nr:hypothetical protein [Erwinia phage Snitter]